MPNNSPADLIVVNADIRTMDPLQPRVRALASRQGRIVRIGDDGDARGLAGPRTRIIDGGGRLLLPGFQDTHIHLQDSGTDRALCVDLEEVRTPPEMVATLAEYAGRHPGRDWVHGVGWYSGVFGEHNLDRHLLDRAVPDRPCFIFASDGHNAAMNSRGFAALGIDAATADPLNGSFVRAADGSPAGLIYEAAIDLVRDRLPARTSDDFATGVRFGQALCNRHGITGVLDALVKQRHLDVYRRLDQRGELTVRVAATALVRPEDEVGEVVRKLERFRHEYGSPMLKVHSAKFFLDGVMENRTAAMLADYSDAKGGNAPVMFGENHLRELFVAFDAARFQIHVHVIGDKAARVALDCLEAARQVNGWWPSLHQLAHVQALDPADIPRFRELGVTANIQPLWARHEPSVTDVALPMLGQARGEFMYAFRSLIDAGAHYAVSSDWGVSTLNPFPIMQTAVTRQPPHRDRDHPVFLPEQRMTVEEVVRGYTLNAAATAWRSDDTGSLAVGKGADLIVLDRDIFAVDPYAIADTEVLLTLVGGREVHRADGFGG